MSRIKQSVGGWNIKKIDHDKISNAIQDALEYSTNSKSAIDLSNALAKICDECMPKKKLVKRGHPVY